MSLPEQDEERGFTLVEVLIALAILGVSLGVILTTVSESLSRTRRGEQELAATALAQSLLARAGADVALKEADVKGESANGLTWRLKIDEYGNDEERTAWEANPVRVVATVSWLEAGEKRSIALETLKLFPVDEER